MVYACIKKGTTWIIVNLPGRFCVFENATNLVRLKSQIKQTIKKKKKKKLNRNEKNFSTPPISGLG